MIHVAYPNASTYVLTVWEKKPLHCTPYLPYIKKEYMLQSIQPQKNHENHVGLLCIWQSYLFAEKLVQKLATRLIWFHWDSTQGNAPVKCAEYMIYSFDMVYAIIVVNRLHEYGALNVSLDTFKLDTVILNMNNYNYFFFLI